MPLFPSLPLELRRPSPVIAECNQLTIVATSDQWSLWPSRPADRGRFSAIPSFCLAGLEAKRPLGRLGTADEVAKVVTFLLSDDASFVTGAYYLIDGSCTAV